MRRGNGPSRYALGMEKRQEIKISGRGNIVSISRLKKGIAARGIKPANPSTCMMNKSRTRRGIREEKPSREGVLPS